MYAAGQVLPVVGRPKPPSLPRRVDPEPRQVPVRLGRVRCVHLLHDREDVIELAGVDAGLELGHRGVPVGFYPDDGNYRSVHVGG